MFTFFEKLVDPFADYSLEQPPRSFWAFMWFYTRPVAPYMVIVSLVSALISIIEVAMFGFVGDLVNWFSASDRSGFLSDHGNQLLWMGVVLLVILPLLEFVWQIVFHQTVMGNYPTSIRWRLHRYLLRQSMEFYQDEFAGRVAQKVMQTALAVREVVTRLADVFVYVCVYFVSALYLIGSAKWQLALPLLIWIVGYIVALVVFVPRMRDISKAQADARSEMVGKVVDAYSNISVVKLFSHAAREDAYAKQSMVGFMDNVYVMMRLVTIMEVVLKTLNNLLLFSSVAVGIYYWMAGVVLPGDIALVAGLVMRLRGMSEWILWEVSSIFENIGTVQDGISTISQPQMVQDVEDAKQLVVQRGEIAFDKVCFDYGKDEPSSTGLS